MNLSVSNLGINSKYSVSETCKFLRRHGVTGIEIAPTKYWPYPTDLKLSEVVSFSSILKNHGISVSALQSLLFNRQDLLLFDKSTWGSLRSHLCQLIDLCAQLESRVLVFGSPKNRKRGKLSPSEADAVAAEFLMSLEGRLKENGVVLSIEPNASIYGCDWIRTFAEAFHFTSLLGSAWISPQIDTGSQISEGENLINAFSMSLPGHIHISEINLGQITNNPIHYDFGSQILGSGYRGWVVLEMLHDPRNLEICDKQSLLNFLSAYQGAASE